MRFLDGLSEISTAMMKFAPCFFAALTGTGWVSPPSTYRRPAIRTGWYNVGVGGEGRGGDWEGGEGRGGEILGGEEGEGRGRGRGGVGGGSSGG